VRTAPVILAALLTEIVVIAAASNQWVSERIAQQIQRSMVNGGSQGVRDLKATLLVYNWRIAPQPGDTQHSWLGQMLMLVTVLFVTGAVLAIVVRGPGSFGRVLLTGWIAVVAATALGAYVRGFVTDTQTSGLLLTRAVFGPLSPNSFSFFASLVLGFVVGLGAAFVARATRGPVAKEAEPAPVESAFFPPEQPPPYYGEPGNLRPWQDQHYGPPAPAAQTTRLPVVDEPTAPRASGPTTQPPPAPTEGDRSTTRFPRPPDDDDLGHV
jgi:hypothetical protein